MDENFDLRKHWEEMNKFKRKYITERLQWAIPAVEEWTVS